MIQTAASMIDTAAQLIGYAFLSLLALVVIAKVAFRLYVDETVSDEAKEIAKEVDPNSPVTQKTTEFLADTVLDSLEDLEPGETIRADPEPVTIFDWSTMSPRQEDVEHILATLQEAGYHTHPLPMADNYQDRFQWDRERAGVWHQEPKWHIVEFDDATAEKQIKESVDLSLPSEWDRSAD